VIIIAGYRYPISIYRLASRFPSSTNAGGLKDAARGPNSQLHDLGQRVQRSEGCRSSERAPSLFPGAAGLPTFAHAGGKVRACVLMAAKAARAAGSWRTRPLPSARRTDPVDREHRPPGGEGRGSTTATSSLRPCNPGGWPVAKTRIDVERPCKWPCFSIFGLGSLASRYGCRKRDRRCYRSLRQSKA
jgi:hypothetical protein